MQPRSLLLGLATVALGVAVYAAFAPRAADPGPDLADPDGPARAAGPARGRAGGSYDPEPRGPTVADALQRVLSAPPEPEMRLPPAEARRSAEASFESIMQTLEDLADAGKRLPRARRDQLYRNTNDAFSALSAQLDPADPADMQLLEDANIRMKAMLHEVGVRVPRRPAVAE